MLSKICFSLVIAAMSFAGITPQLQAENPAKKPTPTFKVSKPPRELVKRLNLDSFYKKYVSANGFPVLSSEKVSDYALREAAYIVNLMLAKRNDVRKTLIEHRCRLVVMAYNEFTSDIPEYGRLKPHKFWDRRARGLGGSRTDPVASCAEENMLCFPGDPYSTENILIHEFAHLIHLNGMTRIDPTFDKRLRETYNKAMAQGLWKGKYASKNKNEYFAEGVQSWFDNNRQPDHDHNFVDTRKELIEYDPGLAKLCKEVFGETKLKYVKPTHRKKLGHLKGYDFSKSPRFRWPKGLDEWYRNYQKQKKKRK